MRGDKSTVGSQTISYRCAIDRPDFQLLTPLDWVVLDFTDGLRSFEDMARLLPTSRVELNESFIRLRRFGLIDWNLA